MSMIKAYPATTSASDEAQYVTCTTSGTKVALDVNVTSGSITISDDVINVITKTVVTVTNAAYEEIVPVANQIYVRVVPIEAGTVYWGPDDTHDETDSEGFDSDQALKLKTDASIFLMVPSGAADTDCVVYQGAIS